jgi:hypothetical protein
VTGTGKRGLALAGLALLLLLPVVGSWWRRHREKGCAYDNGRIDPTYRVRIETESQGEVNFCCIRCAEKWLERKQIQPKRIWVTDEPTGEPVPAAEAFFVRSLVVTTPLSGNRIHAFKNKADADLHARQGKLLTGSERPFAIMR